MKTATDPPTPELSSHDPGASGGTRVAELERALAEAAAALAG